MLLNRLNPELKFLIGLDKYIHGRSIPEYKEYHRLHIEYTKQYALILNNKLGFNINEKKLTYAAMAHDLLKEKGLINDHDSYHGIDIPSSTVGYVRTNLDVLAKYHMDDYFNTSAQYHPLAAAIFLSKELSISDPMIIYPIMFHSCPIMSIYQTLPINIQHAVDIIMLSDKLSSNWLRINFKHTAVKLDLEQAVFGLNGNELHYDLGLYLARLIVDEKPTEIQAKETLRVYEERFKKSIPYKIKKLELGGSKIWPERKSKLLKIF